MFSFIIAFKYYNNCIAKDTYFCVAVGFTACEGIMVSASRIKFTFSLMVFL